MTMKDYDIKIKNSSEVTLYGTEDNTIVVPATVKFDTDHEQADIDIDGDIPVKVGIPKNAEHIEIDIKGGVLNVSNLAFERIEIDTKGDLKLALDGTQGAVDINIIGGNVELRVPKGFAFNTRCEGKNNNIECNTVTTADTCNMIELNGKNSVLKIIGE